MSECVVRMEMPEKCGKCYLAWYDGAGPCYCMATLERNDAVDDGMMWKEADPNKKPSWCPILCQLPEGHGRLGDLDALCEGLVSNHEVVIYAKNAPTIVPADTAERSET